MKKISQKIATSFLAGKSLQIDNTYTDGSKVYLHSNLIAYKTQPDKLHISLAGYPTLDTRERLNAILNVCGYSQYIQQIDGQQYIINEDCDSKHLIAENDFLSFRRVGDHWR